MTSVLDPRIDGTSELRAGGNSSYTPSIPRSVEKSPGGKCAFNDPPVEGNLFYIATLEATYSGDDSSTFWIDMTLKAIGESNVAYEAFEASRGVIPDDINDAGETFPGGTICGNVCWSVGAGDVASLAMIAEESFTFEETRVFFALAE